MYIKHLFIIPEHKRLGINYIETGARFYFQGCPTLDSTSLTPIWASIITIVVICLQGFTSPTGGRW